MVPCPSDRAVGLYPTSRRPVHHEGDLEKERLTVSHQSGFRRPDRSFEGPRKTDRRHRDAASRRLEETMRRRIHEHEAEIAERRSGTDEDETEERPAAPSR